MGTKLHSFSTGFKRLRQETGLTQQEFADKLHFSVETIRNWEQGRSVPEINTILDLCSFFDCSMDHLFDRIPCKTHDAQFIYAQTGLDEKSQRVLSILKKNPAAILVLNYLIQTRSLLDKLVGYYAHAFEKEATTAPFYYIPVNKKNLDPRLFFSDVFDLLPRDRTYFYEKHSASKNHTKTMVFDLIYRCLEKHQMTSFCQLIYDDIYKNKSSKHDDKQLTMIAEFIESFNYGGYFGLFDRPLSEYYNFSDEMQSRK